MAVVGLALVGVTFVAGPKAPAWPSEKPEPVDYSSPSSVMHALGTMNETGIAPYHKPTGPELMQMRTEIIEYQFWQQLRIWMGVAAGVGAVVAVVSRFLPKRKGVPRPLPRNG